MGYASGTVYGGADIMMIDAVGARAQSGFAEGDRECFEYWLKWNDQGFVGVSWEGPYGVNYSDKDNEYITQRAPKIAEMYYYQGYTDCASYI